MATAGFSAFTTANGEPDEPLGFTAEPIAPPAGFTNDVSLQTQLRYDESGKNRGAIVSNLRDAGNVVVAEVTWEPGGTSGWHTHPGPVIVSVVEGELEVTNADDCVSRTYGAGEAWVDPGEGNVHTATNPAEDGQTKVIATFFGVPDGEPATEWVPAADC